MRNDYFENLDNISAKILKRTEVTAYAANYSMAQNRSIVPKPFTNECWGITWGYNGDDETGEIEIGDENDNWIDEKFYK